MPPLKPMTLSEIANEWSKHAGENGDEICWAEVEEWCRSFAVHVVETARPSIGAFDDPRVVTDARTAGEIEAIADYHSAMMAEIEKGVWMT